MRRLHLVPFLMTGLLVGCPGPSTSNMDGSPEGGGNDAGTDAGDSGGGGDAGSVTSVPQTEAITAAGLECPADVVTDHNGWRHIYACSLHDAMFVEGMMQARDRMPQMDILRRLAEGSLSEIFGDQAIDSDLSMRVIGMKRVAEQIWNTTPDGRAKRALQAFADGVNSHAARLRAGTVDPPAGTESFFDPSSPSFRDWTPVDSIALGRYQSFSLSYDDGDIPLTDLRDRTLAQFDNGATADRHARGGFFWDFFRFQPPAQTAIIPDFYTSMGSRFNAQSLRPVLPPGLFDRSRTFLDALDAAKGYIAREDRGSNNWVVAASASMTGHALLANDPHLQLTSPSVFWGTQITVTQGPDAIDFAGTAFPGIPAVILGYNTRISWAATVTDYDVTDAYAETVTLGTGGAPNTVLLNGAQVPITVVTEQIPQGDGSTLDVPVSIVPHHGPIVPNIQSHRIQPLTAGRQLSIHWTGDQPTYELSAVVDLIYAQNVAQAKQALEQFGVGAQNFMIADSDGNIGYSTHSNIPIRDPRALSWDPTHLDGNIPCLVLPGTGEAEWNGFVPSAQIPNATGSPARPFLVSANNDQVGSSFDNDPTNDPQYLACQWDIGFRATRITERLTALTANGGKVTREDMAAIQADHKVLIAGRYLPFLDAAFARLTATWGGTANADLDALATSLMPHMAQLQDAAARLHAWETGSLNGASGLEDNATDADRTDAIATAIYHAWMVRLADNALGDEFTLLNSSGVRTGFDYFRRWSLLFLLEHPDQAHTLDSATGQSAIWDDITTTSTKESRDFILLKSLDEALGQLGTTFASTDVNTWLWGKVHAIRFTSLVGGLAPGLSIPPPGGMFPIGFPRPGGLNVVDASDPGTSNFDFTYGSGPSQRFSVDMDPTTPHGFNVLPGGEDIDINSPHHADEAELWRRNQTHAIPRTVTEVVTAAEGRIHITAQ